MKIEFILNGQVVKEDVAIGKNLLEFLREYGVKSVKNGCDYGECGSCTVLINGQARNACLTLIHRVNGKEVETVEALGKYGELHPLQEKFINNGAIQCGYCTPGMLMSLEGLYRKNPEPDESDVREALAGNLCRCTGYVKPVEAAL